MRQGSLYCADLFAGGGGFSTGVARTCRKLDRQPDLVAINHWHIAIRTHKRNHPWARHLCTGLEAVDPTQVCPNPRGRLNLLVASPECTHFSRARGGRPMSDQSRASAWLVLKWLQELYVENVIIENVQEFEDWGPLGANGRPLKRLRGALFDQFIASLKALGYRVEWRILNAADYGGATTRERLFIMARRGGRNRIVWPDATHGPEGRPRYDRRRGGYTWGARKPWRPAREIIDWSIPSQSIFTRKKPLAPATIERIAAGLRKFGGKYAEPFLLVLRRHADARSIHEPLPTITAGGQHIGLVEPFVLGQQSGSAARPVSQPIPTVAAGGAISLVQPFIFSMEHKPRPFVLPVHHGARDFRTHDIEQPMPTITTVDAWGLVEPFLVEYYGTGSVSSVREPVPTVTTRDRFGLVTVDGMALDIHFRMLHWRELARAMGFPEEYEFEGTREQKVKQIGNAVHVDVAEALAMAAVGA